MLSVLSKDLGLRYGKGFGRRNVLDMRRFYLAYQIWQAVPAKLSWTHIVILLGVSDITARKFYEAQALKENWGTRELERQVDSYLFERLALSKNKAGIMELANKGHVMLTPKDNTKVRLSLFVFKCGHLNGRVVIHRKLLQY